MATRLEILHVEQSDRRLLEYEVAAMARAMRRRAAAGNEQPLVVGSVPKDGVARGTQEEVDHHQQADQEE